MMDRADPARDETVRVIEELTDAALGRGRVRPLTRFDRASLQPELTAIHDNADVDAMPAPAGAMRQMKRAVLKLGGFNWVRQRAVNRAAERAIHLLGEGLDEVRSFTADALRSNAGALAAIGATVDELREELDQRSGTADEAEAERIRHLDGLARQVDAARADLDTHRRRLGTIEAHLRAGRDASQLALHDEAARPSEVDELYARYENAFRPGDQHLRSRLAEYLPDLEPLRGGELAVIDVGAGRGEFVLLLNEHGIPAYGVDLDTAAIGVAREQGATVEYGDAVTALEALDPASVGAITAFHLVEHLPPETVVRLLDAAHRALVPGGTIIVETPNPTNLRVGASSFYSDPTHLRPIHPEYLQFVVGDRGFIDAQIRFLHPLADADVDLQLAPGDGPLNRLLADVQWALWGPMDYAVLARRPTS